MREATVNQTNNRNNNNNNTTTTTTMSDTHHPHPTLHAHFEDDTSSSTNTDTVRQQGQAAAAGPDAIPFSRPSTPTVPIEKIAFVGLGNMVRCVAVVVSSRLEYPAGGFAYCGIHCHVAAAPQHQGTPMALNLAKWLFNAGMVNTHTLRIPILHHSIRH
jgi:hypothetical protein